MENHFATRAVAYRQECNRPCSELIGLAEGLMADAQLNDAEIVFLNGWLEKNDAASCEWPGDVLRTRVREVLADGVVTEGERAYLVNTLKMLVSGHLDRPQVCELPEPEMAHALVERWLGLGRSIEVLQREVHEASPVEDQPTVDLQLAQIKELAAEREACVLRFLALRRHTAG